MSTARMLEKITINIPCQRNEISKVDQAAFFPEYAEIDDCIFDEDSELETTSHSECEEELEDNVPKPGPDICKLFVDGNESDYQSCEYEDELLERVWWLSKPPRIPKRSSIVSARTVQVMKERLSSSINAPAGLSDTIHQKVMKNMKRRKVIASNVGYVNVISFDGRKTKSCQEDSVNIVPECARRIAEIF